MSNEELHHWETEKMDHMIVYCVLSTLIILIGIPANSLSLSYFILREETKISKMIFIWLNAVDLFVCLWMIPQAILTYSFGHIELFKSRIYCSIRLATYPSSLQLSIFITQLLCLTRTYSIVRPLVILKRRYVSIAMIVFIAIIFGRVIQLFISDDISVRYSNRRLRCSWIRTALSNTAVFNAWNIFLSCCMLIPTFVGCTTAILLLFRDKKNPHSKSNPMSQIKRDANITVVIITIICMIGYIQFIAMTFISRIAGSASVFLDNLSLIYACSAVSAINPVVYFIRIKRLRRHAYYVCRRCLSFLKLKPRLPESLQNSKDIVRINLRSGVPKSDIIQRNNTVLVTLPESSDDEAEKTGSLGRRAIILNAGLFVPKHFDRKLSIGKNFISLCNKKITNAEQESTDENNKNDLVKICMLQDTYTLNEHPDHQKTKPAQNFSSEQDHEKNELSTTVTLCDKQKRKSRVDYVLNFPCEASDILELEKSTITQHETYLH